MFWNLESCSSGISGMATRSLYLMCLRVIVEYGCQGVVSQADQRTEKNELKVIQSSTGRRIIGAFFHSHFFF